MRLEWNDAEKLILFSFMANKTLVFVKLAYVSPMPQWTALSLWYCLTLRCFGSLFGMKTHLPTRPGIRIQLTEALVQNVMKMHELRSLNVKDVMIWDSRGLVDMRSWSVTHRETQKENRTVNWNEACIKTEEAACIFSEGSTGSNGK